VRLRLAHTQVDAERTDAKAIRRTVVEEEVEVKLKQAETQHLKDDAQRDLEHVRFSYKSGVGYFSQFLTRSWLASLPKFLPGMIDESGVSTN